MSKFSDVYRKVFVGSEVAPGQQITDLYCVRYLGLAVPAMKIIVIKNLREITNSGLKEAKDICEGSGCVLVDKIPRQRAEKIVKTLIECGANADCQPSFDFLKGIDRV